MPMESARGGHGTGKHGWERRLVDLDLQSRGCESARDVRDMRTDTLGERLGEITTRAVVSDHLVAVRPFHCRGERPRTGYLHLERAGSVLRQLLDDVEVLCQQRTRTPMVDIGGVGEPPPCRLEVDSDCRDQGCGSPDHCRVDTTSWKLREERQIEQLAENRVCRLAEVGARHRADACRAMRHGQTVVKTWSVSPPGCRTRRFPRMHLVRPPTTSSADS